MHDYANHRPHHLSGCAKVRLIALIVYGFLCGAIPVATRFVEAAGTPVPAVTGVIFRSDFECGNGTNFVQTGPTQFDFELEPDTNSTDRQWFYFEVSGANGTSLQLRLLNTNLTNVPGHWSGFIPVSSTDNGQSWQRVTGPSTHANNIFTFTHTFTADNELIAVHNPYTETYLKNRISEWILHPDVTHSILTESLQGRDIDFLRITDATTTPSGGKRGFWIVARQHAAEVTGSWLVEGLIDFVLSSDPRAIALRQGSVFNIVPMMNPDGVVVGNYRDNSAGVNLNREWNSASATESPSVLAAIEAIDQWVADGHSFDWFGDIHSTSGNFPHFGFHAASSVLPPLYDAPPNYHADSVAFLNLLESYDPDFDPTQGASTSTDTRLAREFETFRHGVLAFTFEAGVKKVLHGPDANEYMTPERHRAIGRGLALALREYFEIPVPQSLVTLWMLY